MIARIPGSGAIAACGIITGFDVGFADRSDDTAIYDFLPDGNGIYRFTLVATDLPDGFRIKLRTHHQGATFANGSRDFEVTAADFDENGIATIEILYRPGSDPRVCHTAQVVDEEGNTISASSPTLFNLPPKNRVEIEISREKIRVNDDHQKGEEEWDKNLIEIAQETDLAKVTLRAWNCSPTETAYASFGVYHSGKLSEQFWKEPFKFTPATMTTSVTLPPFSPTWVESFYVEGIKPSVIAPDVFWWGEITNGNSVERHQTVYQLDLDVDSNNNGTIDGDDEDKMEESTDTDKPGKLLISGLWKDSDEDNVPDFADGLGLPLPVGPATGSSGKCGDDKAKLVEMKVKLETPIEPENAEVVFDYAEFASIPRVGGDGNIIVAGTGADEMSPRTYHLKKTGLRIWAVDAKDRDGSINAGKDVSEEGGKFIPPGKTLKWSDIAEAAQASPNERELTLYLEYATSAPPPGQTQTQAIGQKTLTCTEVNAGQSGGVALDKVNLHLLPADIGVDNNRDGTLALGSAKDQTMQQKPYRFWLNNDDDTGYGPDTYVANIDNPWTPTVVDSLDDKIKEDRDLEDFSRIHLKVDSLHDELAAG